MLLDSTFHFHNKQFFFLSCRPPLAINFLTINPLGGRETDQTPEGFGQGSWLRVVLCWCRTSATECGEAWSLTDVVICEERQGKITLGVLKETRGRKWCFSEKDFGVCVTVTVRTLWSSPWLRSPGVKHERTCTAWLLRQLLLFGSKYRWVRSGDYLERYIVYAYFIMHCHCLCSWDGADLLWWLFSNREPFLVPAPSPTSCLAFCSPVIQLNFNELASARVSHSHSHWRTAHVRINGIHNWGIQNGIVDWVG